MKLVVGYGNPLRGDDGVGWRIAEALPPCSDTDVITCQMLLPELVPVIAAASLVVFADARLGDTPGRIRCLPVVPSNGRRSIGHVESPSTLLSLAATACGHVPPAWLVSVDVADLQPGATLSGPVSAAIPHAVAAIARLVDRHRP
jgi:hydrogenase maturation protease